MLISDAYKLLTTEGQRQARVEITSLCLGRKLIKDSESSDGSEYVYQVIAGLRRHACSPEVAVVVSGYFRGVFQINVSPADVINCVRPAGSKAVKPSARIAAATVAHTV